MVNIMSMRSSFIYGYGFNCDCEDEKLIDFVKAHSRGYREYDTSFTINKLN